MRGSVDRNSDHGLSRFVGVDGKNGREDDPGLDLIGAQLLVAELITDRMVVVGDEAAVFMVGFKCRAHHRTDVEEWKANAYGKRKDRGSRRDSAQNPFVEPVCHDLTLGRAADGVNARSHPSAPRQVSHVGDS